MVRSARINAYQKKIINNDSYTNHSIIIQSSRNSLFSNSNSISNSPDSTKNNSNFSFLQKSNVKDATKNPSTAQSFDTNKTTKPTINANQITTSNTNQSSNYPGHTNSTHKKNSTHNRKIASYKQRNLENEKKIKSFDQTSQNEKPILTYNNESLSTINFFTKLNQLNFGSSNALRKEDITSTEKIQQEMVNEIERYDNETLKISTKTNKGKKNTVDNEVNLNNKNKNDVSFNL